MGKRKMGLYPRGPNMYVYAERKSQKWSLSLSLSFSLAARCLAVKMA